MDNKGVTKKNVLITGANGGIGLALVDAFLADNYHVIAVDLHNNFVKDMADQPFDYIQLDLEKYVENESMAESFIDCVKKTLDGGGLNALVNNAAYQFVGSFQKIDRKTWKKTMDVNLNAPFLLVQDLLQQIQDVNGSVVNISSIHACQTKKNFCAYATSKCALSGLTRNMAVALGDSIRVNAIEPAAIATSMLKEGFLGKEHELDKLASLHPLARIGKPCEVANLALFLCSSGAGFITGECIQVTGGIHGMLVDSDI